MKNKFSLHLILITTVALSSIAYSGGFPPASEKDDPRPSRHTSPASTEYLECGDFPEPPPTPEGEVFEDAPGSEADLYALISQETPSIDTSPLMSAQAPLHEHEDATGGADAEEAPLPNEPHAVVMPASPYTPTPNPSSSAESSPATPKKRTPHLRTWGIFCTFSFPPTSIYLAFWLYKHTRARRDPYRFPIWRHWSRKTIPEHSPYTFLIAYN